MHVSRDNFLRRLEVREWHKRNGKDVASLINSGSSDQDIYSTEEVQPTSEGDIDWLLFFSVTLPLTNLQCLSVCLSACQYPLFSITVIQENVKKKKKKNLPLINR